MIKIAAGMTGKGRFYGPRFMWAICFTELPTRLDRYSRRIEHAPLDREGENPVPHYWAHVHWAFGASDQEDFLAKSQAMNLNGHMDRIEVPFLVTHGGDDRQISVSYADDLYDQLINSPRREKVIFTAREGGVEHVGADNMAYGRDLISDWFAETLGEHAR